MENIQEKNGKFLCQIFKKEFRCKDYDDICPRANHEDVECYWEKLTSPRVKFVVINGSYMFVKEVKQDINIDCVLSSIKLDCVDLTGQTVKIFKIFMRKVYNDWSINVDLKKIQVINLAEAFNLGFRVDESNQKYWQKNIPLELQEEYKGLAKSLKSH